MCGDGVICGWCVVWGAWVSNVDIIVRGVSDLLNYRLLWNRGIKRVGLTLFFSGISVFLSI